MRKTYKFSHKVVQGGQMYCHKLLNKIENKLGFKNALKAIVKKYKLIDATIKVYDNIFFIFYLSRNIAPQTLIDTIHQNMSSFGKWDKDYMFTNVYDLQEKYVRKDLEEMGFDYDKGT